jgi:23S rRNA (guanosine2251-2'-O)-methyltransferase
MQDLAVLLHNIRSAHNVGSIFRTADAAGVSHVYLSGYTPTPIDRFGRPQKDIAKTALGAEASVPWSYTKHASAVVQRAKREGRDIIALEQSDTSIDYRRYDLHKPALLIVGNEVRGVSPALVSKCDAVLEIPMRGKKESLNVSVATGVILFQLLQ